MSAYVAILLILVPAPSGEGEPTGAAPTLMYLKKVDGAFETAATLVEMVPVTRAITTNVNGRVEVRTITTYQGVTKIVRQRIDLKGAAFHSLDGKKLEEAVWQKALGNGAIVVVAKDGQMPHPAYLKVLREGTMIMIAKPTLPPIPPPNVVPALDVPKN